MLVACGIECIIKTHVGVERVILRTRLLFRHRIIKRCRNLRLVGEELAQFDVGSDAISLVVVLRTVHYAFLKTSETFRHVLARSIKCADIAELNVECCLCSPSSFVVILQQSQFIYPHLSRLIVNVKVAHTNNHSLHFAKSRITHHGDTVVRTVRVVVAILTIVRSSTACLRNVSCLLNVCEDIKVDVKHVLLWPHLAAVGQRITVITSCRSKFQRYQILVVVALIVASETHEHSQLVVMQVSNVILEGISMHKHLQSLILAKVYGGVLVNRLRLVV